MRQRFYINEKDCQVLYAEKSTHRNTNTQQAYVRFKVPQFVEMDLPEFILLITENSDSVYVIPTQVVIESGLQQMHVPLPPISPRVGERNERKINFEDYLDHKGMTLLKRENSDLETV